MPTASDYDFGAAFARIEAELINSMMRNLRRHLNEESELGFDWSQWQAEQLRYLEEYRQANQDRFGPRFASINSMLEEAIADAYSNGQKEEEIRILETLAANRTARRRFASAAASIEGAGNAFFRVNDRKLEALLNATRSDMQQAEWAVLRRANDQYRKIIFNAQVYANTGAGTVQKAADMAMKDFLMRGIDCIEYRNGARHTISDYADMAIRTAERRAYLYGEGQKRQEWGVSLVIVNKRGGHPCPHCAKWAGKILIDDVYSGGKPDGKHTLLSEAMSQGFLHPRCKDGFTTYFPGVTTVPDPATKGELRDAEKAEAEETRQQNAERMAERWERRAKYSLDPADKRQAEARAAEWRKEGGMSKTPQIKATVPEDVTAEYAKNATPGDGLVTHAADYDLDAHPKENRVARWLHSAFGGNTQLLTEANEDKVSTPDYLWNGKLWELKSPTTEKAANSAIKKGLKQIAKNPGGIILDYEDHDFSMDVLQSVIEKRMQWHADATADIMIVSRGKVVKVIRYRPK